MILLDVYYCGVVLECIHIYINKVAETLETPLNMHFNSTTQVITH